MFEEKAFVNNRGNRIKNCLICPVKFAKNQLWINKNNNPRDDLCDRVIIVIY